VECLRWLGRSRPHRVKKTGCSSQTVGVQRTKLAALDANDPDFVNKASHLAGPDLGGASAQMQQLTSNKELAPGFRAAPQCQQLSSATAGHR
jgi:hypothetical protein